jgi:hypothetical protein
MWRKSTGCIPGRQTFAILEFRFMLSSDTHNLGYLQRGLPKLRRFCIKTSMKSILLFVIGSWTSCLILVLAVLVTEMVSERRKRASRLAKGRKRLTTALGMTRPPDLQAP